eukprot:9869972-Alexandrium_andersonii.AAC.1
MERHGVPQEPTWELLDSAPSRRRALVPEPSEEEMRDADKLLEQTCTAHLGGRCTVRYCQKLHLPEPNRQKLLLRL